MLRSFCAVAVFSLSCGQSEPERGDRVVAGASGDAGRSGASGQSPGGSAGSNPGSSGAASGSGAAAGSANAAGNDAGGSAGAPGGDAGSEPCGFNHLRRIDVSTAIELVQALGAARPGELIALAEGSYLGKFRIATSGVESNPIVVCGSRRVVLDGGNAASGYALHIEASYVVVSGFALTNAQKGVVIDGGNHNLLSDIEVFETGMEAVHFRKHSSYNSVERCFIHDTGLTTPGMGEAVYIGSAVSNWPSLTNGEPDRSDHNHVLYNRLGPNVRGEHVDIKEGTSSGIVSGNEFDGSGMNNANFDDSWVDLKGSQYTVRDNVGINALLDGFQVHVVAGDPSSGQSNVFEKNRATINAPDGYAFRIPSNAPGNLIRCDNRATPENRLANIACSP